jgi:hypothetical protein
MVQVYILHSTNNKDSVVEAGVVYGSSWGSTKRGLTNVSYV